MKALYGTVGAALVVAAALAPAADAQTALISQPMVPGGATLRWSQLWIDPSGQNDSDLDCIAWEDFTPTRAATITRVQWWGHAPADLGFEISFFAQDPNTIAIQPDIFRPGGGPLSQGIYTTFTQTDLGGGLYSFSADLTTAQHVEANTRYFVSIVGRQSLSYVTWDWARGVGPNTGTFYWQRADGNRYTRLGEDRAVALFETSADLNGDGLVNSADLAELLGAWGTSGGAADLNGDGIVNAADLAMMLGAWG